jgi:hypothetical protein
MFKRTYSPGDSKSPGEKNPFYVLDQIITINQMTKTYDNG